MNTSTRPTELERVLDYLVASIELHWNHGTKAGYYRGSRMNALRSLNLFVAFLLLFAHQLAHAQYIYLDANGDGVNTVEDRLDATDPTVIDIWLDTNHRRDGSSAGCLSGEALTLNSYDFIIHADGGTVAWAEFANHQPTMTLSLVEASDSTDYHNGRAGGTILSPGLYRLASLTVTAISGAPELSIAQSTGLSAIFLTSFGSQCQGLDADNTLKLGSDWFDAAGVGPPDLPPTISAPSLLAATVGSDVSIQVDVIDSLAQTVPAITATGYPSGLTLNVSQVGSNGARGILSGHLGINDAGTHAVVWTATGQGGLSSSSTTTMSVSSQSQTAGATIAGYTTSGQNVVVAEGADGISARLGVWGAVWPWAYCQEQVGYPCTPFLNQIQVAIDVDTGVTLSFSFEFMQYGTPFLPDDLQAVIGDGITDEAPLWNYGNPQSCWGSLWQSPRRTVNVDLSKWAGSRIWLTIWVRDCAGHQTDAVALIHSIAIRECYVTPLVALSAEDQSIFEDNPNTPVESMLTTEMKTALSCLRSAVQGVNGSLLVKSAYRTQSYQAHLRELYDKWKQLEPDTTTFECQNLRTELKDHMHYHDLDSLKTQPASQAGLHTKGLAIDARWSGVTDIDALACQCGLYRPLKIADKRHFVLKTCPTP